MSPAGMQKLSQNVIQENFKIQDLQFHEDKKFELQEQGWKHNVLEEFSESERIFKESIAGYGEDPDSVLGEKFGLAISLCRQKKYAEAESYILDVVPINSIPTGHGPQSLGTMRVLVEALEGQSKHEEAKKQAKRAIALAQDIEEPERETLISRFSDFLSKLNPNLLDA
jgi:hypothetical protein